MFRITVNKNTSLSLKEFKEACLKAKSIKSLPRRKREEMLKKEYNRLFPNTGGKNKDKKKDDNPDIDITIENGEIKEGSKKTEKD